jgi:AraC-like DNA-binding protein
MDMQMTSEQHGARAGGSIRTHQLALVERACAYIDEREGERVTLAELGDHLGVSPWHLQRLFRKVMGVSPRDYADAKRSGKFRSELKRGESIAGATYGSGYGSSSRIYEVADQQLGMTRRPMPRAAAARTSSMPSWTRPSVACWWRRPRPASASYRWAMTTTRWWRCSRTSFQPPSP